MISGFAYVMLAFVTYIVLGPSESLKGCLVFYVYERALSIGGTQTMLASQHTNPTMSTSIGEPETYATCVASCPSM